jgi:hypothetical protein
MSASTVAPGRRRMGRERFTFAPLPVARECRWESESQSRSREAAKSRRDKLTGFLCALGALCDLA